MNHVPTTRAFTTRNRHGKDIFCLLSSPTVRNGTPGTRLVIIPPAYEMEVHKYLIPALYLSLNGLSVLRFDAPNHVGRSDGDIYSYDLVENHETVADLLDHCVANLGFERISFLCTSLASRYSVRGIARSPHRAAVEKVVNIVPVVDVRKTLMAVCGVDFWVDPKPEWKIVDHVVSNVFVDRADADQMHTLESTLEDMKVVTPRNYAIIASEDDWVDAVDVRRAFGDRLFVLPGGIHEFGKNPNAAMDVMNKAVDLITEWREDKIRIPSFQSIVAFNAQEREIEERCEAT